MNHITKGSRVQFKLKRPYTKEEIKMGYDNAVDGITGTIVWIFDTKKAEVCLDSPLTWKGETCYSYTDFIDNMILL